MRHAIALILSLCLAACGDNAPGPSDPDAAPELDAGPDADLLPSCEAIGCAPGMPLLCSSDGRECTCPTDAGPEHCERP